MANMDSIDSSVEYLMTECEPAFASATQIVSNIRRAIFDELGYTCSAGISTNKLTAKFIAGMKKPNAQCTLLPEDTERFMADIQIRKLRGFGGKLGDQICERFDATTCGQIQQVALEEIQQSFGQSAEYIWEMVRVRFANWHNPIFKPLLLNVP